MSNGLSFYSAVVDGKARTDSTISSVALLLNRLVPSESFSAGNVIDENSSMVDGAEVTKTRVCDDPHAILSTR